MDIILFGIQGSGKGTLADKLAQKYGYQIIETGKHLRHLAQEKSKLGEKIKTIIESGNLVSDNIIMEIVENFINNLPTGTELIFDGIPRTMKQAIKLEKLYVKHGRNFMGIFLEVPEEVIIRRLTSRRICPNCKAIYTGAYTAPNCLKCGEKLITRSDDNLTSIKTRIKSFYDETLPMINHLKSRGKIIVMDGNKSIEDATKTIIDLVEKHLR